MISDSQKKKIAQILIPTGGILCLFTFVSAVMALMAGVMIAFVFGNPYSLKNCTHRLLAWSVIGLGAGMNLEIVARVGLEGLGSTLISIGAVFLLGFLLQKLFQVDEETGLLITVGTAICGGSAIAAVTPMIRAKPHSVSVALGTVFILNAIALVIFPPLGHFLHLSEHAFGMWSALAIHDTSSVVGATMAYGQEAAATGTTVKLARALWIVPVALLIGYYKNAKDKTENGKVKIPFFIFGFLIAAALVTWIPILQEPGHWVESFARRTLVLTLFLIGLGLSRENLQKVGIKPFLLGITLWLLVGAGVLVAVYAS